MRQWVVERLVTSPALGRILHSRLAHFSSVDGSISEFLGNEELHGQLCDGAARSFFAYFWRSAMHEKNMWRAVAGLLAGIVAARAQPGAASAGERPGESPQDEGEISFEPEWRR